MIYGADIVKWTKRVLDDINRKTRKVLTLNKELHPRSDIDRLYVSRMEGRRGLIVCKMSVRAEEDSLGCYVKRHIEHLIVAVRISNSVPSEMSTQPNEFKQQDSEETLNNWRGRTMLYVRQIEDKDKSNIWKWLRKSNLKESIEALIYSAHKQSPRTNYVKFHIDKTGESLLWRMCKVESKTISHIMGECKTRYDNVCRYINWKLCEKHNFQRVRQWYEHEPDGVIEKKGVQDSVGFYNPV